MCNTKSIWPTGCKANFSSTPDMLELFSVADSVLSDLFDSEGRLLIQTVIEYICTTIYFQSHSTKPYIEPNKNRHFLVPFHKVLIKMSLQAATYVLV